MIIALCLGFAAAVLIGGAYRMAKTVRHEEVSEDALVARNEAFGATLVWTQERGFHHRDTPRVPNDEAA
jgi:hypothetical protein